MNPERTLMLVGHRTETVATAKSMGLDVILLQHVSTFEAEQAKLADITLVVDYRDWTVTCALAETAHKLWGFSAALSLTEPGLEVAGRINDLFGLGGTGYAPSHLLRDKLAMRRHLAAAAGTTNYTAPPLHAAPVTGAASLAAFGARHGYPFMVKPTDLGGGFGIFRVDGPAEVDEAWERIERVRATGVDRGPTEVFDVTDFFMEEYVDGPEFSVEAFSFAGRHVVLGVTEKLVTDGHFAELGHTLPARIGADLENEIVRAVAELLDTVGIKDGPSHTELRISERGPVIIESHNRFGGGRIKDMVKAVYRIDLTAYSVGWPFHLVDALERRPEPHGGACIRFLHGGPGKINAITGIEELRDHPRVVTASVSAKPGDVVRPLRDNWDRVGLVAVVGSDSDAAVRLCGELIENSVHIQMAPQ